jgi:hypothetical protein
MMVALTGLLAATTTAGAGAFAAPALTAPTTTQGEPPVQEPAPPTSSEPATEATGPEAYYHLGHGAEYWHWQTVKAERRAARLERQARKHWQPTAIYAIRLASVVYGVPFLDMLAVAECESGLYPYAEHPSSHASGLFQMVPSTWRGAWGAKRFADAGFIVWDPVANALAAASMVVRDGGWRQWVCKP